jgi:hypothetical protein
MAVLFFILGVWIVLGSLVALAVGKFMRMATTERRPSTTPQSAASFDPASGNAGALASRFKG